MSRTAPRNRTWLRSLVVGATVSCVVFGAATVLAPSATAADSSAVTVTARDQAIQTGADITKAPFPDLKLTVSQTRDLAEQAITVSWAGGKLSTLPSGQTGGENFLQLMQCWDDGSGQPDRTTCQYGGFNTDGARRTQTGIEPLGEDIPNSGTLPGGVIYTGIPFRAATGKTLQSIHDGKLVRMAENGNRLIEQADGTFHEIDAGGAYLSTLDPREMPEGWEPPARVDLNNNEFFTRYTTNEVPWAGSGADGRGSITFETQSALTSHGLGCGAVPDGASAPRACWLVAVPRGEGTNTASGLAWSQWKYRLAVKLEFQQVGDRCTIGTVERQLAGSELAADAIASWQPGLCSSENGSAFSLLKTTDADAAAEANTVADAPLAMTSRPLVPAEGVTDDLTYAPIALTSVVVAVAIDRAPLTTASEDARARARQPFTDVHLTPRLLAKLMTSSYLNALPTDADRTHLGKNPRDLLKDPDFLEVNADNPDWSVQAISGAIADVMVPQGRSDALRAVWDYILADREARDFLAGNPDPYGMIVNPYAATDPARNPTGTGLEVPRSDAPKVDPSEAIYLDANGQPITAKTLNSVSVRPYTSDLASGAYYALRGDGLTLAAWDEISIPNKWTRASRSLVGERAVIALTDASAASRYETVTASLRNPAGQFVTSSTSSMLAAGAAMTASEVQPQVLQYDPASDRAAAASTAYPLTMPVYAATNRELGSDGVHVSYADFIRSAVDGQNPGTRVGDLPAGFAPLPDSWREQALKAANVIEGIADPVPAVAVPAAPQSDGAAAPAPPATAGAAAQVQAPAAPAVGADPAAAGAVAAPLSGGTTGDDPDVLGVASAVPISLAAGAAAAIAVPFVGRLRRPDDL